MFKIQFRLDGEPWQDFTGSPYFDSPHEAWSYIRRLIVVLNDYAFRVVPTEG